MNRKKTGLTYLETHYNVDEKKNKVTCRLIYGIDVSRIPYIEMILHNDEIEDMLDHFDIYNKVDENGCMKTYIASSVVGYSYCSPDDKFDPEFGKKLSLTRAQIGAFEEFGNIYSTIFEKLTNALDCFEIRAENCFLSADDCISHVNDIIDKKYK